MQLQKIRNLMFLQEVETFVKPEERFKIHLEA